MHSYIGIYIWIPSGLWYVSNATFLENKKISFWNYRPQKKVQYFTKMTSVIAPEFNRTIFSLNIASKTWVFFTKKVLFCEKERTRMNLMFWVITVFKQKKIKTIAFSTFLKVPFFGLILRAVTGRDRRGTILGFLKR